MVEVSEKFKRLAQQNGRHVYCKILAGNETFFDDRIVEFDFDDVAHPDWFTVGTACSNRFTFSVRYAGELNVRDEVKPYISFDNAEWCPLGVFYVARRYVRGKYASITCYDKMYGLNMEYVPSVEAPTTVDAVLRDACAAAGIECGDFGYPYAAKKIPEGCTVRDIIAFAAAMNQACAKFDRAGKLVFKRYHGVLDFFLSEGNCTDCVRNMSHSVITCVKADTGEEILRGGDGAEISTLELYDPFMTQKRVDDLVKQLAPLSFYGAEIKMQGMPFLESGECIFFEENSGMAYAIFLSEIEYHYDGALTAALYSKNKCDTDAAVHRNDLEAALEEIRNSLGNVCLKQVNENAVTISRKPEIVADFEFETKKRGAFAQIDINCTADMESGAALYVALYVNGAKISREAVHAAAGKERGLVHYYHLAADLPKGKNNIRAEFYTVGGTAAIEPYQLIATLVAKGLAGGGGESVRDRYTAYESVPRVAVNGTGFGLAGFSDELERFIT